MAVAIEERREEQRHRPLGNALLERRAGHDAAQRRDRDQRSLGHVDVPVQRLAAVA